MTRSIFSLRAPIKTAMVAAIALGSAGAASMAQAEEISISTTWALETEYVFRGVQYSETALQPDLSISYGDFTVGAWASIPVGDDDVAFGDEIDIYGSYETSIAEGVAFSTGFTYYMFPDAASGFLDFLDEDDGEGANTFEIFGAVGFDTFLAPTAALYYDFNFEAFTLEGGIGHSFPVAEKTSIDVGGTLGHVFDDDEGGDYTYGSASADLAYAFTDAVSGAVGVRYAMSSEDTFFDDVFADTYKDNSFWAGMSLSAGF